MNSIALKGEIPVVWKSRPFDGAVHKRILGLTRGAALR
jgi:hypothetical protein